MELHREAGEKAQKSTGEIFKNVGADGATEFQILGLSARQQGYNKWGVLACVCNMVCVLVHC